MLVVCRTNPNSLYDLIDGKLSKVLKLYTDKGIKYCRFPYAYYPKMYRKASKKEIRKFKNRYYNEEGLSGKRAMKK